ncbi:MAG: hypothetical protein K0S30_2451, partial [Clostridia bacterium]|nr:hypothetical protein [Clostridia bacterium]
MKLIKKVGLGVMAVSLAMNAVACSKIQTSNEGTTSIKAETKVSDQPIEI